MTKALKELLEKVEAGTDYVSNSVVDSACSALFGRQWTLSDWAMLNMCVNREPTSLDAAKALHEALLPGWEWGITHNPDQPQSCAAYVAPYGAGDNDERGKTGDNPNPARAWLICILKAKIAESEDE